MEIRPAQPQPFDAVREDVERDLRDRRAEQRQIQLLDDLLSQTFESPESLAPAARVTGLEVHISEWFTRSEGDGIAAVRGAREAAFSNAVLTDGRNSEAVDLPDGSTVVLRVQERRPPSLRPLAEVAEDIRALLQRDAATAAALRVAEALLEEIAAGTSLEALATADDASPWASPWAVSASVPRSGVVDAEVSLPQPLRERLFQMPAPRDGESVREVLVLPTGDAAVIVLEAVDVAAVAGDLAATALDEAAARLQAAVAAEELRAYLAWLEAEAEITRHPGNLE